MSDKTIVNNLLTENQQLKAELENRTQMLSAYECLFVGIGFSLADARDIELKEIKSWKDRMLWHCQKSDELLIENQQLKAEFQTEKEALIAGQETLQKALLIEKKQAVSFREKLLKATKYVYVRHPNRVYMTTDFEDGEILEFYGFPEKPSAYNAGYYFYKGKNDIRLIHCSDTKAISYEELLVKKNTELEEANHFIDVLGEVKEQLKSELIMAKSQTVKEFVEKLKGIYSDYKLSDTVSIDKLVCDINRVAKGIAGETE